MAAAVKFVVVSLLVLVAFAAVSAGDSTSGSVSGLDQYADGAAASASASVPLVARLHHSFSGMDDIVADGGAADVMTADDQGQQGGAGWMMECLSAVTELRSCTNEIVLFFFNGESYLGRECCLAIRTVTRHCWPSILASVGFTAEEADVLRGYCEAEVGPNTPQPVTPVMPPPATAPAPAPVRAYI